ncbi:MAG: AI-2E family transporter [Candidatus Gastranaerophilales bacterium]|nr:AI-2E family transporter [Candidatus Gastranaerophilales bacterium]
MENPKRISYRNVIVILATIAVIALCILSLDILMMLFAAYVITCAILPIVNKMEKFMPRVLAVTLILFAMILASILIIAPLLTISTKEAIELVNDIPNVMFHIGNFLNFEIFGKTLSDLITFESLKDSLAQGAQQVVENSIAAGKWIANFFTTIFAIAITVFYLAYDEKRLKEKFVEFFPQEKKERALSILENISSKVGNYVFAQGIAMVFVGVVTTIGLLFLQNTHAFLLGFITCVFDIVPVVGPAIAIGLGLITSIPDGLLFVILTFVVYMVAQWSQNQLLRPIVFGKLLNMHPLLIIVSLLISARFLGLFGVILAPAITCVICVLVDELYLKKINNKE